jgi:hypothetical protein
MPRSSKPPPPRPRRRSAAEWATLLDELTSSPLDIDAFADIHGVTASRLRWWRWHFRRTTGPSRPRDPVHDLRLVPLRLDDTNTTATASWEIVTPRGSLRVLQPLDHELLLRAVALLVAQP